MFENVNSLHRLPLQNYFIKLFKKAKFLNSLLNIKLLILDMTKCHYIMFTVDISLQEQGFYYPSFCGFKEFILYSH